MAAMRRAAVIGKERRAEVEILDIEALNALASGAVTLNEACVRQRQSTQRRADQPAAV
jgi:hypothetical protein